MSMIHYEPYGMAARGGDIGRLFDAFSAFLPRHECEDTAAGYDWSPAVDIKEEGGGYVIRADVPGIAPDDIDVSLEDGVLAIRGERKFDSEEAKEGYRRVERAYGVFTRRFSLPDTADQEKVTAKCENGVLEVAIEKQEKTLPKKIAVNA